MKNTFITDQENKLENFTGKIAQIRYLNLTD